MQRTSSESKLDKAAREPADEFGGALEHACEIGISVWVRKKRARRWPNVVDALAKHFDNAGPRDESKRRAARIA